MKLKLVAALLLSAFCSVAVWANDSTASFGTGGLVLTKTKAIKMRSEKLLISPSKITVDYEFENTTDKDITTTVAFPLPVLEISPGANWALPTQGKRANYVDFKVTVAGQSVTPAEHFSLTNDVRGTKTALLKKLSIPLLPEFEDYQKFENLPGATLKLLQAKGLFIKDSTEPIWNVQTTYTWPQTFPAKQLLAVHHEYRPITGIGFLMIIADDKLASYEDDFIKDFCVSGPQQTHIEQLAAKLSTTVDDQGHQEPKTLQWARTQYVLTTANNWQGPIGDFQLTIDTEAPENTIATCFKGLHSVSPTLHQLHAKNYRPLQNVDFKVIRRWPTAAE